MAKNILQDIVPPEKRSIRNIPLPRRGSAPFEPRRQKDFTPVERDVVDDSQKEESYEDRDTPKVYPYGEAVSSFTSRYSKKGIWGACFVALLLVLFAFSSLFVGATVRVTPVVKSAVAQGIMFNAYQGPSGNGVQYEVVKISKDLGTPVTASGEENVSVKSSGTVVIYNSAGKAAQRLIKNTRFQTSDGLIFRINESVVVPGQTVSGKDTKPGGVEVTIYADEPGEKYNIGLVDFTIPGFKGDPRFTTVYARSKTQMTGGFVGTKKKVSEGDTTKAQAGLKTQLSAALSKEVRAQIPPEYVVFPDGMVVTYEDLAQSNPMDSSVQVNERGTLWAIMFNKNILSQYLSQQLLPDMSSSSPMISNLADLKFTMQNKATFDPSKDSLITFAIDGTVSFVSQFDTKKLVADLAGKPKSSLQSVLSKYPGIANADATVRPFWKQSFPNSVKSITLTVQQPK